MRVIRLYTHKHLAPDINLELDDDARHHATSVLRLNKHSKLTLFNGDGFDYTCNILDCKKSILRVNVTNQIKLNNESPLNTQLYLGISKGAHMDYAIQKTVEAGVSSLHPILMERTVSKANAKSLRNKHLHWQRIIQSACEQSGRAVIPKLSDIYELSEIEPCCANDYGILFDANSKKNIQSLKIKSPVSIKILIGPEGGLTDNEIELAMKKEFKVVNCGPRVLRSETAAHTAVLLAQREWGDLA